MKVKDVITLVKNSFLRNLNIKDSDTVIMGYIYLGLVELNRRFNFNVKSEVIHVYPELTIYELRDDNVDMLLSVYSEDGCELKESNTINSKESKFKQLTYRSFVYTTDKDEDLVCVYKGSPSIVSDVNDVLPIPDSMLSALLAYIAYIGYSTIGSDTNSQRESDRLYSIYATACDNLEGQGYRINIFNESLGGTIKGFV